MSYICTHKVRTNQTETTYRIELSGGSGELVGAGDVFNLEYERIDPTKPYSVPLQTARLEFNILVRNSSDLSLLQSIFNEPEGSRSLSLYQDGQLIFKGSVLSDLLQYPESDYPFEGRIIAKDLTALKGYTYPLSDSRQTVIKTIADILDILNYNYAIEAYTNWGQENITDGSNFLGQIYLDTRSLREFRKEDEKTDPNPDGTYDLPLNAYDALELILRNFGLILRQANGKWRIYQLSALTGASVNGQQYLSTGQSTFPTSSSLSESIDSSSKYVLPASVNTFNPGLKKVTVNFNHRTIEDEGIIPNRLTFLNDYNEAVAPKVYQYKYISDSREIDSGRGTVYQDGTSLKLKGTAISRVSSAIGALDLTEFDISYFPIEIKIQSAGVTYYLQDDDSWSEIPNIRYFLRGNRIASGGAYVDSTSFDINTDATPDNADGILYISFYQAQITRPEKYLDRSPFKLTAQDFPNVYAISTTYEPEFEIVKPNNYASSQSVNYEITQAGAYSVIYNHGSVYFGDGPVFFSPSALRYGTGNTQITDSNWGFVGGAKEYLFHELLLKEILYTQAGTTRNLSADLYGAYNPVNRLSYQGQIFFFLGGRLNGRNVWKADFLSLQFAQPTSAFLENINEASAGNIVGATGSTLTTFWDSIKESQFFNTVFLQNYVGELSEVLEAGSRTSCTANLSAQLRQGEDFILVDKENERPFFINVTANVNTGEDQTVSFDEQYFPLDLPVGTPIIMSGGLLQSYFTIDPTKLKIQVDNVEGDFATLELRVGDNEASIEQSVQFDDTGAYTKLIAGPEGSEFQIVADQINITGVINAINDEGVTTIDGDRITTGTITANEIDVDDLFSEQITVDATGSIRSSNYVLDTSGFLIEGNGDAEFNSVTVRNGLVVDSIDRGSYTSGNTGIQIVANLANITNPVEGEVAFLATDAKLYRYDGSQWTSAVPTVDLTGEITETQIADDSISTPKLQANAVTANEIASNTITANEIASGTITANEILSGTITSAQIASNTITANEIASNTITAGEIASGTITATEIATGTITADKINVSNLFSQQITIGTGGYIQGNYSAGSTGFRINANGTAEFRQVTVAGQIITDIGSSIDGQYVQNINAGTITAGTISADRIGANSITADKINVTNLNAVNTNTGNLTVDGTLTISTGGSITGSNYLFNDAGGNVAGWIIQTGTLKSQASGARIELNKADNRISIFDAVGEKAVMGYLNGVPKNDGSGNWGSNDYGFWAKDGDYLQIDGDMQYESGDWIVQNDASIKIFDGSNNEILRLGTDTGNKGLFLYNTSGDKLAQYRSDAVIIGDDTSTEYLKYQSGVLTVRGSINADDITAGTLSTDRLNVATLSAITTNTGTLTVSDTLTMGASGEITNSASDFVLDSSGLSLSAISGNVTGTEAKAIKFGGGGYIAGRNADTIPGDDEVIVNGDVVKIVSNNAVFTDYGILLDGDTKIGGYLYSDGNISLGTFGSFNVVIESNGDAGFNGDVTIGGNLIVTSGKGIDFSATANGTGSSQSELLDDYEEGVWAPTFELTSGTVSATYDRVDATYIKIGNQVVIQCYLRTDSLSFSGTGNIRMGGLPFAVTDFGAVAVGYAKNWASGQAFPQAGYVDPGDNKLYLQQVNADGETFGLTQASFSTGINANHNAIILTATYTV